MEQTVTEGPEERGIRRYVMSQQAPASDLEVAVVQKVGRRRVGSTDHDLYDVWMSNDDRWWVITNMTNLYYQQDFKNVDQAFTYHLSLNQVLAEQFRTEPNEDQTKHLSTPWRKYARAVEAMTEAKESEDFQGVGVRCREAILALVREYHEAEWVRVPGERPQLANAKEWIGIFANSLTANSKPRAYLKAAAERTFDLTNWLQHYYDATELDAEFVLAATNQLMRAFALLMRRHEQGSSQRCPRCNSYQLAEENGELVEHEDHWGMFMHDECVACNWTSEPVFDQWETKRLRRLTEYRNHEWDPPKRSMEELDPDYDDKRS
jgi:hypothetical protein